MSVEQQLPILGVLGGGQLGRMLIQTALNYNLTVRVMDGDENAPCKNICDHFTHGALLDYDAVLAFGRNCDIITIEIESVNTDALKQLIKEGKKVFPQPEIIQLIQNKRHQKEFYQKHNIPTAPFVLTDSIEDLKKYPDFFPAVHKLATGGYDGKGVSVIHSFEEVSKGFDAPCVLEKFIPFEKELAVIVARNAQGQTNCFPAVALSFHPELNLVEFLFSPANIDQKTGQKAMDLAQLVADKLGIIGLLAVEMFLTKGGEILVNEIAPRTHNSGHQSIEGNITSQFDQHLRAVLGWPLGDTAIKIPSAMVNIIGEKGHTGAAVYQGLAEVLAVSGAQVHLYGKKITKPGRKMGHVTIVDQDSAELVRKATFVKDILKVVT